MEVIQGENKFTLQNFDKRIGTVILQRGKQYYEEGAVLDIEENQGRWTAEVEGSDIYTVTVSLKKDSEIIEYFCDCPYDGDICKHLVAVFYTLREEISNRIPVPKKPGKRNQFEDLLSMVNAEEYREFTRHYALINKDFKIAFEVFFADKDDRIDLGEKYRELIQKLVKKSSYRGFVDYRSSSGLAKEVSKLIDKGYEFMSEKNYRNAFVIAKSVLREMMQVVTACDDSNGLLSGTVFKSVELINSIAGHEYVPIDMKEHIFNFLQMELNDKIYFEYGDFGYNLFSVFKRLAIEFTKHKEFLDYIEIQLSKFNGQYDDYKRKFFKTAKIDFLKAIGRDDEAENLVQQNLDIEEVRQGEVNKAIDKKDFTLAKKLIADGIKIAEFKKHPGTVLKWEEEFLRIAVLENDLTLVREYCKRFALNRWFGKDYYEQWKETYSKEEWPVVIEEHINKIIQKVTKEQGKNRWYTLNSQLLEALDAIYIKEKYWDRLLALIKNESGLEKVMKYHTYLVQPYPAELLQLYLPGLELQGDEASDRGQYAHLVGVMKKIIKDIPAGEEQIITIAKNLKAKYPRRPAMVDELNKLLR